MAVENFFRISKPTDWRLAGWPSSVVSNWDMISLRKPRFSVHDRPAVSCFGGAGAAGRSAKGSVCWPDSPATLTNNRNTRRFMTHLPWVQVVDYGDGSRAEAGEWTEGWREAQGRVLGDEELDGFDRNPGSRWRGPRLRPLRASSPGAGRSGAAGWRSMQMHEDLALFAEGLGQQGCEEGAAVRPSHRRTRRQDLRAGTRCRESPGGLELWRFSSSLRPL